jgi:hypothetical protein
MKKIMHGQHHASALRKALNDALPLLMNISDEMSGINPAPGKWSKKEIIGHLIDSACNNHRRFVLAQLSDSLNFPGYTQDEWVCAQHYNLRPWEELVELWRRYNTHLAHVMENTPDEVCFLQRHDHNLDEIAFKTVPANMPATLSYFMDDYIKHLYHHLMAVFANVK